MMSKRGISSVSRQETATHVVRCVGSGRRQERISCIVYGGIELTALGASLQGLSHDVTPVPKERARLLLRL